MKNQKFILIVFLICCYLGLSQASIADNIHLIPYPNKIEYGKGHLTLPLTSVIEIVGVNDKNTIDFLSKQIKISSNDAEKSNGKSFVKLEIIKSKTVKSDEWYKLEISKKRVVINATSSIGLMYGVETLNQLLFQTKKQDHYLLPFLKISDTPAYTYRGFMLDASRHMQSVEMVKAILDFMLSVKLNVYHWHLTDDQGWRIESKRYPKLNEIASYSVNSPDPELNGYYTIEEIHEILNYAKQRNIKVIPEVDVPGHSWAVLNTFPNLRCSHAPYSNAYCAGNAKTLPFIKSLFDEVIEIFQPEYIHIGGDERKKDLWSKCPLCENKMESLKLKNEDALQNYFLNEISQYIHKQGVTTIAWAENLEGGIPENQITQAWRLKNEAITAIKMGHSVVVSDNPECYLDYPTSEEEKKAKPFPSWMSILTSKKVYNFDFVPDSVSKEEAKLVLGGECALWTEIVPENQIYKQIKSRIEAHAERSWTVVNSKDFDRFEAGYQVLSTYFAEYFENFK